jgi:hypothetical protein
MKRFLRLFRYVRELEEELKKANHWLALLRDEEVAKIERSMKADPGDDRHKRGAWIAYQMKLRQITAEDIATFCVVSTPFVNQVVWGKRTSARIQKQIATSLGYSSWLELLSTRKEIAA